MGSHSFWQVYSQTGNVWAHVPCQESLYSIPHVDDRYIDFDTHTLLSNISGRNTLTLRPRTAIIFQWLLQLQLHFYWKMCKTGHQLLLGSALHNAMIDRYSQNACILPLQRNNVSCNTIRLFLWFNNNVFLEKWMVSKPMGTFKVSWYVSTFSPTES